MVIGVVRAKRITDAWAEQKIVREIMVFLHSNGVGTARAVRIFKTYGADAVQVMTENPYRLARDIRGIGFKSADAIAMRLGIEKTAMIRLRAGISYALTEAMDEGHCGLPTDQLIPLAEELLEAPKELILTALELERSEGAVIADKVGDTASIFLAGLYRATRYGNAAAARSVVTTVGQENATNVTTSVIRNAVAMTTATTANAMMTTRIEAAPADQRRVRRTNPPNRRRRPKSTTLTA